MTDDFTRGYPTREAAREAVAEFRSAVATAEVVDLTEKGRYVITRDYGDLSRLLCEAKLATDEIWHEGAKRTIVRSNEEAASIALAVLALADGVHNRRQAT